MLAAPAQAEPRPVSPPPSPPGPLSNRACSACTSPRSVQARSSPANSAGASVGHGRALGPDPEDPGRVRLGSAGQAVTTAEQTGASEIMYVLGSTPEWAAKYVRPDTYYYGGGTGVGARETVVLAGMDGCAVATRQGPHHQLSDMERGQPRIPSSPRNARSTGSAWPCSPTSRPTRSGLSIARHRSSAPPAP